MSSVAVHTPFSDKPATTRVTSPSWSSTSSPSSSVQGQVKAGSPQGDTFSPLRLPSTSPCHWVEQLCPVYVLHKGKKKSRAEVSSEEEWLLLDAGVPSGPAQGRWGLGTDSAEQMLPVCTVTHLTRQLSCCCKDPRSCSQVVATSG